MNSQVQSLIQGYLGSQFYDEMFEPNGAVKPSWQVLYDHFCDLGANGLKNRQKEIDWNLAENGITYNIFNDPNGQNRPWNLNVVPFVMPQKEWLLVENGLKQRAHLLDLIAKDIYGPQRLISEGIIPYEIIYSHRGFLRPCVGIALNTPKHLSIYAADLSRGPDGRMWVVHDRTGVPSGMGYALENRTVSSQILSNLYGKQPFKSHHQFFNAFNTMLANAAPANISHPNIVILTEGPASETYFEHAYLASHFGYPMLRGSDLVVRNGSVWMKSLKELKKIDVIFSRIDSNDLDPLELRGDSYLGVAGLLNVVRNKNVSIINPMGTGVVENSGLIPFMPAIAKYFLNEDLLLPQIATYWCGQAKERNYVLNNITNLVIKRIDRSNRESIVFGEFLKLHEVNKLIITIESAPHLYVAQEKIKFSTVPNFANDRLEPRKMVCRSFVIASNNDYEVMPGGLVRVASTRENVRVSNQRGGISMDFCVVDTQVNSPTASPNNTVFNEHNLPALTSLDDLPSLTAENLYWAGRYISRALITARHLRMITKQLVTFNDAANYDPNSKIAILLQSLSELTNSKAPFFTKDITPDHATIKQEVMALVVDKNKTGSLAQTIDYFSNAYFSIRNLWSADMWRVFDSITSSFSALKEENNQNISYKALIKVLNQLITRLIAFMGLIEESILVEQGLLLYFLGLNIESASLYVEKCQSLLAQPIAQPYLQYEILEALLLSHESLNIYRYSYRSHINIKSVVSLLILEDKYARSLTYLIRKINKDLKDLPHSKTEVKQDYEIAMETALGMLKSADVANLITTQNNGSQAMVNLEKLLKDLDVLLNETTQSISDTYFNHVDRQSQLANQIFN